MQNERLFATSILLHLGLVTHSETDRGLVKLTNPATRTLVARTLQGQDFSYGVDDAYCKLVEQVNFLLYGI